MHQGRIIQSRSRKSIIDEVRKLAQREDFRGTITDIGGPTANLYAAQCKQWTEGSGTCKGKKCLIPVKCANLRTGYRETLDLWREAAKIPGVKNIFIGSGVRYDLLIAKEADEYLRALCKSHVSGLLKVAPEHSERGILALMNKPAFSAYEKFAEKFDAVNKALKKKQYLVNYFIAGHPATPLQAPLNLALTLKKKGIRPEQIQDYLPLPMTVSGSIYHTEKDPFTGAHVYVAKGERERKLQRALIQYNQPQNKKYVIEALRNLGREDLIKTFFRYR